MQVFAHQPHQVLDNNVLAFFVCDLYLSLTLTLNLTLALALTLAFSLALFLSIIS